MVKLLQLEMESCKRGKTRERHWKRNGFVEGYHIFENSAKRYDGEYVKNCEKFIEDVIIKEIIK